MSSGRPDVHIRPAPRDDAIDRRPGKGGAVVADMVGVPLYRRIAADVRARVDRGDLVPGARVETEPELMARYGVSRATVRQAFDADGAVIEYCRSTVRADRHRCSVELRDR